MQLAASVDSVRGGQSLETSGCKPASNRTSIIDRQTILKALAHLAVSLPAEKRRQVIRVKVNYGNGAERKRLSKLVTDAFHDLLDDL